MEKVLTYSEKLFALVVASIIMMSFLYVFLEFALWVLTWNI